MRKKLGLLILACLFGIVTFTKPALGAEISLQESLNQIVSYYENDKSILDNWEEVIGLENSGVDLSAEPWQLPEWEEDSLNESSSPAKYASVILGMLAANQDPENVNGRNLVDELSARQAEDGSFGDQITDTTWSVIALDKAQGNYHTDKAVTYLVEKKTSDGGFAWGGDTADPDITGYVLLALGLHTDIAGVNEAVSEAALCLQNMQLDDGGFASWGTENPESIATVIRGLVACGEDITTGNWDKNGKTMIDALFAFQLEDKSFAHAIGGGHNDMATRQALIAVADMVKANIDYQIEPGGQSDEPVSSEVTVRVRVEGAAANLRDEVVTVAGTALDALKAAVGENSVQLDDYEMINIILGESAAKNVAPETDTSWMYYVMREGVIEPSAFSEGPGSYQIQNGDEIIFYIGAYDNSTWEAKTYFPVVNISPNLPTAGQSLTINISAQIYDYSSGLQDLSADATSAIGSYTVIAGEDEYTSSNGQVTIPDVPQGICSYTISNTNDAGYADVVAYRGSVDVGATDSPGGGSSGESNSKTVYIAVVGQEGNLLYGPDSVQISEADAYGVTAMSALAATGLSWSFSDSWDGLVVNIAGEENEGLNGWMYSINGNNPSDVPMNVRVSTGAKIIFWYSTDPMGSGPKWSELGTASGTSGSSVEEAVNDTITSSFSSYSDELSGLLQTEILNADKKMSPDAIKKLIDELAANTVDLDREVGTAEAIVGDTEVSMLVPENALAAAMSLTVKELTANEQPQQFAVRLGSSTYEFGPGGTRFAKPITISIKLPITEDINIATLTPAWYDQGNKKWIPVPGLIDLEAGLAVFQIDHFTKFAVISLPARISFADVGENWSWAQDAIEILAGKGIINGTDAGFEPQKNISRAEFVQLLITALQLEPEAYADGLFSDVNSSHWFAAAVACACNNKIVAGYPDNTFRPNESISRNEVASIIYHLEGNAPDFTDTKPAFIDVNEIPAWATDGVKYVYKQGLMNGYEDNSFQGSNPLTRAEAAVIIYKYLNSVSII